MCRVAGNPQDEFFQVLGGIFREEDDLRLLRKRLDIGGIGQASAADIALYDFFKVLFEKADIALRHLDHTGAVGVAAADGGSEIRKAGGNHCTQVPGTVDPHVHGEPLPMERPLTICKDGYSA